MLTDLSISLETVKIDHAPYDKLDTLVHKVQTANVQFACCVCQVKVFTLRKAIISMHAWPVGHLLMKAALQPPKQLGEASVCKTIVSHAKCYPHTYILRRSSYISNWDSSKTIQL